MHVMIVVGALTREAWQRYLSFISRPCVFTFCKGSFRRLFVFHTVAPCSNFNLFVLKRSFASIRGQLCPVCFIVWKARRGRCRGGWPLRRRVRTSATDSFRSTAAVDSCPSHNTIIINIYHSQGRGGSPGHELLSLCYLLTSSNFYSVSSYCKVGRDTYEGSPSLTVRVRGMISGGTVKVQLLDVGAGSNIINSSEVMI